MSGAATRGEERGGGRLVVWSMPTPISTHRCRDLDGMFKVIS